MFQNNYTCTTFIRGILKFSTKNLHILQCYFAVLFVLLCLLIRADVSDMGCMPLHSCIAQNIIYCMSICSTHILDPSSANI
jgi:hypothetical protein